MTKKKEILEAEVNYQETLLRWRGIPALPFISGLAALLWLLVGDQNYLIHLNYTLVLAVLCEKIIWTFLSYNEIEGVESEKIHKLFLMFKDDILIDLLYDIIQIGICLYLIYNWEVPNLFLEGYFFLNLALVIVVFLVCDQKKLPSSEMKKTVDVVKSRWVTRAIFVMGSLLGMYVIKIAYNASVEKFSFNNEQLKSMVLLIGIFLLVRFYQSGRSILTIILFKKNELTGLLREE